MVFLRQLLASGYQFRFQCVYSSSSQGILQLADLVDNSISANDRGKLHHMFPDTEWQTGLMVTFDH